MGHGAWGLGLGAWSMEHGAWIYFNLRAFLKLVIFLLSITS
jgi:hypothetical protein